MANICNKCNFSKILILLLAIVILIVIPIILVLIHDIHNLQHDLIVLNKIPELKIELKAIDAIFALASVYIAFAAYRIQVTQSKIQKGQAIAQLNQAFNDINKLVINENDNNSIIKVFAGNLYRAASEGGKVEVALNDVDKSKIKPFIFIILNAYEAYYISNSEKFSKDSPLILKNLFTYYCPIAKPILDNHSYDAEFKKACEDFLKKKCVLLDSIR